MRFEKRHGPAEPREVFPGPGLVKICRVCRESQPILPAALAHVLARDAGDYPAQDHESALCANAPSFVESLPYRARVHDDRFNCTCCRPYSMCFRSKLGCQTYGPWFLVCACPRRVLYTLSTRLARVLGDRSSVLVQGRPSCALLNLRHEGGEMNVSNFIDYVLTPLQNNSRSFPGLSPNMKKYIELLPAMWSVRVWRQVCNPTVRVSVSLRCGRTHVAVLRKLLSLQCSCCVCFCRNVQAQLLMHCLDCNHRSPSREAVRARCLPRSKRPH